MTDKQAAVRRAEGCIGERGWQRWRDGQRATLIHRAAKTRQPRQAGCAEAATLRQRLIKLMRLWLRPGVDTRTTRCRARSGITLPGIDDEVADGRGLGGVACRAGAQACSEDRSRRWRRRIADVSRCISGGRAAGLGRRERLRRRQRVTRPDRAASHHRLCGRPPAPTAVASRHPPEQRQGCNARAGRRRGQDAAKSRCRPR